MRSISSIRVGQSSSPRFGAMLDTLATSIAQIELLHPTVIIPDGTLIAGERRLEACKRLGRESFSREAQTFGRR